MEIDASLYLNRKLNEPRGSVWLERKLFEVRLAAMLRHVFPSWPLPPPPPFLFHSLRLQQNLRASSHHFIIIGLSSPLPAWETLAASHFTL